MMIVIMMVMMKELSVGTPRACSKHVSFMYALNMICRQSLYDQSDRSAIQERSTFRMVSAHGLPHDVNSGFKLP